MIAFLCQCGNRVSVPDEYAGKRGKCRKCGKVVVLPDAPVMVHAGGGPEQHVAADPLPSEAATSIDTKVVVLVGGGALVVAIGVFFWFLTICSNWERRHSAQILALRDQAMELKGHSDLAGASAKLHEILALVGTRSLSDGNLRSAIDDVRANAREMDRLLILRQIPQRLRDAAILLATDDLDKSRGTYNAILDALSAQGTNEPDATLAADRAREGLRQVDARQAAIVAEKAQREAERVAAEQRKAQEAALAAQRKEQEARNAKIRTTISGGAWSVKKGGSSDLLRGMKVSLLKGTCSGASVRECYQDIANAAKQQAASSHKFAQGLRETLDEDDVSIKTANDFESEVQRFDEYATTVLADAKSIPDQLDVRDAYELVRRVSDADPVSVKYGWRTLLGGRFAPVVRECTENSVQVNIDGKFSFGGVTGGKHYLYALWTTEFSSIEWLIPVTVKDSSPMSQDLFNDTAEIIWNKHD